MLAFLLAILGLFSFVVAGCGHMPSRLEAPDWNPVDLADRIMSDLDKNGDAVLGDGELSASPGLAFGTKYIDSNKDQSVSRDELITRFEKYEKMRVALTTKQLQLFYKGRPLPRAKVNLVPEFFLKDIIEPADGETFDDGSVEPIIPNMTPVGLRAGYYRVVIHSPAIKIPTKYGSADSTPLGVEISPWSDDATTYSTIKLVVRE